MKNLFFALLLYSANINSQVVGQLMVDLDFPANSSFNIEVISDSKSSIVKSDKLGKFKLLIDKNDKIVDLRVTDWHLNYTIKNIKPIEGNIDLGKVYLPFLSDINIKKYNSLTPELKIKYKCSADYSGAHCFSYEIIDEKFLKLRCDKKEKFNYIFDSKKGLIIVDWNELKCK